MPGLLLPRAFRPSLSPWNEKQRQGDRELCAVRRREKQAHSRSSLHRFDNSAPFTRGTQTFLSPNLTRVFHQLSGEPEATQSNSLQRSPPANIGEHEPGAPAVLRRGHGAPSCAHMCLPPARCPFRAEPPPGGHQPGAGPGSLPRNRSILGVPAVAPAASGPLSPALSAALGLGCVPSASRGSDSAGLWPWPCRLL